MTISKMKMRTVKGGAGRLGGEIDAEVAMGGGNRWRTYLVVGNRGD
jgi:hypothetical protein